MCFYCLQCLDYCCFFLDFIKMDVSTLKGEGNEKFKAGNFMEALESYTKALDLGDIKDTDKAVIYKNRSMCNLKLEKYETAVNDATQCE